MRCPHLLHSVLLPLEDPESRTDQAGPATSHLGGWRTPVHKTQRQVDCSKSTKVLPPGTSLLLSPAWTCHLTFPEWKVVLLTLMETDWIVIPAGAKSNFQLILPTDESSVRAMYTWRQTGHVVCTDPELFSSAFHWLSQIILTHRTTRSTTDTHHLPVTLLLPEDWLFSPQAPIPPGDCFIVIGNSAVLVLDGAVAHVKQLVPLFCLSRREDETCSLTTKYTRVSNLQGCCLSFLL